MSISPCTLGIMGSPPVWGCCLGPDHLQNVIWRALPFSLPCLQHIRPDVKHTHQNSQCCANCVKLSESRSEEIICVEGVFDLGPAFRIKPGVSIMVRLGQYAYSARSTIGFDETVPAHHPSSPGHQSVPHWHSRRSRQGSVPAGIWQSKYALTQGRWDRHQRSGHHAQRSLERFHKDANLQCMLGASRSWP